MSKVTHGKVQVLDELGAGMLSGVATVHALWPQLLASAGQTPATRSGNLSEAGHRWRTVPLLMDAGDQAHGANNFVAQWSQGAAQFWTVVGSIDDNETANDGQAQFLVGSSLLLGFAALMLLLAWTNVRATHDAEVSQENLQHLLEVLPVGVWVQDGQGVVSYRNAAAQRIASDLSEQRDEAIGRTLRTCGLLDTPNAPGDRTVADGLPINHAGELIALDTLGEQGAPRWLRLHAFRSRDRSSGQAMVVATFSDATEAQQAAYHRDRQQVAETANKAKTLFMGKLSHELRTPLNAVIGFTNLVLTGAATQLKPREKQYLELVEASGRQLLALVDDALELTRIEQGKMDLSIETVSLQPVLKQVVGALSLVAQRQKVQVELTVAEDAGHIKADRTRVVQVMSNLVSNAIKYNRSGGAVYLSARAEDARDIRILVRDTGIGMRAADLDHLFEPFERMSAAATSVEGTGLGLYITRHLVELMGGRIHAASELGVGTSITVWLPRAPAALADRPDTAWGGLVAQAAEPARTMRLLYIEDNETNVVLMEAVADTQPHWQLQVATTGAAGLEAMRNSTPHLVLCDLNLPDTNGLKLCVQIHRDRLALGAHLVALTADGSSHTREEALAAGFDKVLTKPFLPADLVNFVNETLTDAPSRWGG